MSGRILPVTLSGVAGFEHPLLGLALLVLAGLAVLWVARTAASAIPWPAVTELVRAGARRRDLGRGIALVLRLGALGGLAVALAGPVTVFRGSPEPGAGLDLVLVVDTSGSMRALDAELGGTWQTRLDLARTVVARFARTRVAEGDRVGIVVFGENAFTQCPLTSDEALLDAALGRIEPGMAGEATALGDALALAVRRVAGATGRDAAVPASPAAATAGRVIVLLTDGRSNAGIVPIDVAAGLARTLGIRVHAVGIGASGVVAMAAPPGAPRAGLRFERHDLDEETLAMIARSTGGRFFHARHAEDLDAVYTEIDSLERVARRPPPRLRREARPGPALAFSGALLALELLGSRVLRRRLS